MKKIKYILILLITTIIIAGISCKKYEDNPLINIRSKEYRLGSENAYYIAYYTVSGIDSTQAIINKLKTPWGDDCYIHFSTISHKKEITGQCFSGEWDWGKDKKYLKIGIFRYYKIISPFVTTGFIEWRITKLT